MRAERLRVFSKGLRGYIFLLALLLNEVFPNAALAFLSSLDGCAARPDCAAAVSTELAPVIATPTAAAGGPISITATSATGVTTSVQAVAAVTVVGDVRLSGVVAFHIWNQAQNERAQKKAAERYCGIYPYDYSLCGPEIWHVESEKAAYWTGCGGGWGIIAGNFSQKPTLVVRQVPRYGCYATYLENYGSFYGGNWFNYGGHAYTPSVKITQTRGKIPWKDWPQQKRSTAVALLTNSDWQSLITFMPEGGRLNPGDTVNAPIFVLPGQETDDPNTPIDERIAKKLPGPFTNPGLPDTDFDGDSTSDSVDPQPQNPNVPVASDNQPEGSPGTTSISEQDTRHIFRDAPGHLPEDTPANRQTLVDTASNPTNYLGADKYGNKWYAKTRPDGTQVWTRVRNGLIINGGVNPTPRPYNLQTGLNNPPI